MLAIDLSFRHATYLPSLDAVFESESASGREDAASRVIELLAQGNAMQSGKPDGQSTTDLLRHLSNLRKVRSTGWVRLGCSGSQPIALLLAALAARELPHRGAEGGQRHVMPHTPVVGE